MQSVVDEVKHLSDSGVKEVTLLGQNVNSYADFCTRPEKQIRADVARYSIEHVYDLPVVCGMYNVPAFEHLTFSRSVIWNIPVPCFLVGRTKNLV